MVIIFIMINLIAIIYTLPFKCLDLVRFLVFLKKLILLFSKDTLS